MMWNASGSRIPVPNIDATQLELIEFAMTYDGYQHTFRGPKQVHEIANPIIAAFEKDNFLPNDLETLRVTLFWLQRLGHNQEQMDGSSWDRSKSIWHAIVDKIRVISDGYVIRD